MSVNLPPRVLLFGAYANGNIGDKYQAASMYNHVKCHMPDAVVDAISCSAAAINYPLSYEGNTEGDAIIGLPSVDVVNTYDILFVGGGGLLASKHKPLFSKSWVNDIKIPIVVFAVGANEEVSALCSDLLNKAVSVSVRDIYSFNSVRQFVGDKSVGIVSDPILMDQKIDELSSRSSLNNQITFIPRKLAPSMERTYSALADKLDPVDVVLSMFPATDEASGAIDLFSSQAKVVTHDYTLFSETLKKSVGILSHRFHGCIYAMKLGIPVLGVVKNSKESDSKIVQLYKSLELDDFLINISNSRISRDLLLDKIQAFPIDAVKNKLETSKVDFDDQIREAFAAGAVYRQELSLSADEQ